MTVQSNTVMVEVPCELLETIRVCEKWGGGDESRIRMSVAVGLYAEQAVSLAKAAELAGVAIREFESFLRRSGLPVVVYTEAELLQDKMFVRECAKDAEDGA